jgi:phosphate transport system substrate-binding protein
MKLNLKLIATSCLGLALQTASLANAQTLINGAGATFPYPLYSKWFSEYQKVAKDVSINYQSIGSGGGVRLFQERTVDFGASDSPMNAEQMAKNPEPALHIPTALGAVVATYNLPGVEGNLQLTPDVLADIFLGKLTSWDDARIQKDNPKAKLPKTPIMVVHRADGSGTTGIFTDYLSKVSPEWQKKVGAGSAVKWPVGLGGKGNEGVTALVKQTPGTIGYVELIYAKSNKLAYAAIQNSAKEFVLPSVESVTAAAGESLASIPEDFRVSITNPAGKGAYPISSFTYILVYQNQPTGKGEKLVAFLRWAIKDGQTLAGALHYAQLPSKLVPKIAAKLDTIKFAATKAL